MRETLVVLKIRDDRNDRPWWRALRLPEPNRWTDEDAFGKDVYAEAVVELDRTLTPLPNVDDITRLQEADDEQTNT